MPGDVISWQSDLYVTEPAVSAQVELLPGAFVSGVVNFIPAARVP